MQEALPAGSAFLFVDNFAMFQLSLILNKVTNLF